MSALALTADCEFPDCYSPAANDECFEGGKGGPWTRTKYTYDGIGNRLSETRDGLSTQYSYDPSSHRLQNLTGQTNLTLGYDAMGNVTQKGANSLLYNVAGRLDQTSSQSQIRYTSEGQRMRQTVTDPQGATEQRRYHYDLAGHLITEANATQTLSETIWLDDMPLAMITRRHPEIQNDALDDLLNPDGAIGSIAPDSPATPAMELFYIHSNHLNAPQVLTDASQAIVWDATYDPFGEITLDTELLTQKHRFPGQFADDTGAYQNWFRDYDPSLGRYLQSDPIGLQAGLNTYAYVGGNPLSYTDPLGLRPCPPGTSSDPNCQIYGPDDPDPNEGKCVTAQCAAGLTPAPSELRTQEEIECEQCKLVCTGSSLAVPGGLPLSILRSLRAGGTIGAKVGWCAYVCKDECRSCND